MANKTISCPMAPIPKVSAAGQLVRVHCGTLWVNQPAVSDFQLQSAQTAREVTLDDVDAHNARRRICCSRGKFNQNANTAQLFEIGFVVEL